ncbi:Protein-tyrosine phosphatase, partial [Ancylostoma duodenale]
MISELNVTTLVMLSNEEDWSPSEKYWPSELHDTAVYERPPYHVTVQLNGEEHFPYFITRKLSYRMKEDTVARSVVQFAFTAWPSSCVVPTSSEPLLSLVGRVLERQSGLPDSGPIVLHCRNGSSETGVYCCISLLLERLKAEQRIDVFQTVKGLQNQRPLIFSKLEHYAFCYQA